MVHGVRYVRQDVSYLSKKHSCPVCDTQLNVIKASKIINSASEETKEIPPIVPKITMSGRGIKFRKYNAIGNIKWIWKEFECPSCHHRFTVEQMKQIESAPKENWGEMVASFDELPQQTDEVTPETDSAQNAEKRVKNPLKLALCIAIPVVVLIVVLVAIMIFSTPKFVDTNGPDNFELTQITRDDILKPNSSYRSFMETEKHSGYQTYIVGEKFSECDYDYISRSYGKFHGISIIHATKIYTNRLTLDIDSSIESGNAEIVILVDGEYYCSVDVNQQQTVVLTHISGKEVLIKLAGEDAKIKIDVQRK